MFGSTKEKEETARKLLPHDPERGNAWGTSDPWNDPQMMEVDQGPPKSKDNEENAWAGVTETSHEELVETRTSLDWRAQRQ